MNEPVTSLDALFCTAMLIIWLRWPLSRAAAAAEQIAGELRQLRELAERGRR